MIKADTWAEAMLDIGNVCGEAKAIGIALEVQIDALRWASRHSKKEIDQMTEDLMVSLHCLGEER